MGYPKVKVVTGFSTDVNKELPGKMKGLSALWSSADTNKYERTVESAASGYVLFENGACLYVKSGGVMYAVSDGSYYELVGEKAGARFDRNGLRLVTNVENYLVENQPVLNGDDPLFDKELGCFVDRCLNNQVDMETTCQAIELMKIIEGIYKSAETGMPVTYS
jgi:predicted dehydrogenase